MKPHLPGETPSLLEREPVWRGNCVLFAARLQFTIKWYNLVKWRVHWLLESRPGLKGRLWLFQMLETRKGLPHSRSLSRVWLLVTPWTVACQAPLPMGFFQARILEWKKKKNTRAVAISSSRGSSCSGIKPASLEPPALADRLHQ